MLRACAVCIALYVLRSFSYDTFLAHMSSTCMAALQLGITRRWRGMDGGELYLHLAGTRARVRTHARTHARERARKRAHTYYTDCTARHGTARHGVVWRGPTQHGWHDTARTHTRHALQWMLLCKRWLHLYPPVVLCLWMVMSGTLFRSWQ